MTIFILSLTGVFWVTLLIVNLWVIVALLKQQGVGVKGMSKGSPVNEEVPPLLEAGGKIEVCQTLL